MTAAQTASAPSSPEMSREAATREKRMAWWHEAKFGMFIHWGLYSVIGQHEWAMEVEGIPIAQYEILAKHVQPKPNAARDWARLRAAFRRMPVGRPYRWVAERPAPPRNGSRVLLVNKPDATQTYFLIGFPGIRRDRPRPSRISTSGAPSVVFMATRRPFRPSTLS